MMLMQIVTNYRLRPLLLLFCNQQKKSDLRKYNDDNKEKCNDIKHINLIYLNKKTLSL